MEAVATGHLVWCCTDCGALYRTDFPRCPNDGAEVIAASRDPLVGTTVDSYVVEDLIGEGAMGRVYRARHKQLRDRRYALKVLIGDLAVTAANRMRFAKEAESTSRLSHPNVVEVFDVGRSSKGLLYIAMELVDGESAATILDRGAVEVSRVLMIARGVCEGLHHAHGAGLVHRDLKPDNILVVAGDIPRIVDFGLAISTDHRDARLTTTGMAMGTPAYIAPEQASSKNVDHRADLYALGVTMFEMLTGKLPFDAGDPIEMVTAKVIRPAPTISERAPELVISTHVVQLVGKLLERDPADRYQSAAEVLAAIDACLTPPPPEPIVPPARSRRPMVLAALAAVLAVAGAATAWKLTSGDRPEPIAVVAAATTTPPSPPMMTQQPDRPTIESPIAEPADVDVDVDVATSTQSTHRHRTRSTHTAEARTLPQTTTTAAGAAAPANDGTPAPVLEPAPPPATPAKDVALTPTTTPPPPTPTTTRTVDSRSFSAHVDSIDVSGSLSRSHISRALDRIAPAIAACRSSSEKSATVTFTIGESRRAESVALSLSGTSRSSDASCLAGAFAGVRTETAPDVGDATVTVRVVFR